MNNSIQKAVKIIRDATVFDANLTASDLRLIDEAIQLLELVEGKQE